MIKYNNTNNASTTLTAGISPSSTTLIVENGDILPTAPFLLTLEHFDNEKVTVREIVKCIAKVGTILTIQRGAGTCVQDDSATPKAQNNTPHSFSVGDCASIYWTSEQVKDIQDEINQKLNITDFQAGTYVYSSSSTETDAYSITIPGTITSYQLGQVFRFMADVGNTGPATLNINGIGAIEILKNHDKILETGDIEAGQIVEVAFDGTKFQMNSQVATVVDLGNIDSLKNSGIVGELYTLDDELYLQDVSEDLDTSEGVTVINVGYDKEETHIQRIANGIIGNSVSLYIAKVGSPVTNFTIEVRKGIYAEADGRAYWTGDNTQILASKSISYSGITTDLQKITITFDDNIELQKGDLIDVVCYQSGISDEKIKSTTDYYTIGGFIDQCGEGNSVNYVDNGTITKTNIIGYCDMNCFYSALLCNSKQQNVSSKIYQITNLGALDFNKGNSYILATFTNSDTAGTVDVSITNIARSNFGGSYKTNIKYSINGGSQTNLFSVSIRGGGTGSGTISVPANSTVSIIVDGYDNKRYIDEGFIKYNISKTILKNIQYVLKPTTIVPIANETSMISEGNVNGVRFQQPTKITTSTQEPQKKQGQIYYNTTTGKLMFCNGTKRGEITVTYPA